MLTRHSSLAAMLFAARTIHTSQAVGCYPAWKSGGSYTDGSIASNAVATTDNSSVTTASSNYACMSNTNWALCGQPGYEPGTAGGDIVWTSTGTCENSPSSEMLVDILGCPGAYSEGEAYTEGDEVAQSGFVLECKPHPYSIFCPAAEYAPGVDSPDGEVIPLWKTAWSIKSVCDDRLSLPTSVTHSLRDFFLQDDEDQFSTLFEFIQLANLEASIATVGPITFFAPTNAAWDALDPALLSSLKLPVYRKELLQVLSRHVVWDEIHISQEWMVGDTFHVLFEGEALTVTDVNPTVLNGTASIIMPDVLANNGVMHLVNSVILPAGFELKPRVAYRQTSNFGQHHPKANRLNIVALGDSFVAGNGARGPNGQRDYTNALCYRSDSSWPGLYATCVAKENAGGINVQFANHACAGSYMSNIYAKQLSGITSQTDLVFLSVSGNDYGFIDTVTTCYTVQNVNACKERIEESKELMKGDMKVDMKGMIVQLLLDIRAAGHSGMKIILTGYPYFGNDAAFEISNYPLGREMYEAGEHVELIQAEAVAEANNLMGSNFAVFESVKALFAGKEFNADSETINPESLMTSFDPYETLGFMAENYHYNSQGHAALGNYLCTRTDYGASQPVHDSMDEFSKSTLLIALYTIVVASLVIMGTLTYHLRASRPRYGGDEDRQGHKYSTRWSIAIHRMHLPLKNAMLFVTRLAITHRRACIVIGIVASFGLFSCGLATNFNIVTEQEALWTPTGSTTESEAAWVESMLTRWSNNDTSSVLGVDNRDVILTMIVHKKGKNMVTSAGAAKMFDALDKVRSTPGYSDFCAIHGVESACPPGYEYICELYSIPTEPTEGVGAKDCPIGGATGFWFHNRSLYEEQVSSDADVSEAMSLDVFFGDGQQLNLRDVLGNPVHEEGLLVSSTAFLSVLLFRKDADGVESLRLNLVQALLKLQEEWKEDDEEYELQFLTSASFPDEFVRSMENDIFLFPFTFLFMSAFACVAFMRRDAAKSRSALGLGAVFTVLLSILTGYGILSTIGVPITSLTQMLPFVILGIGLDDSFLLKNAYERSDPNKSIVDRIEATIDEVGISIAMTSFTSSLAFALGCFSGIPAVRWLCIYGFVTILIDFLFQITFFLALVALDEERVGASRRDVLCCFTAPNRNSTPEVLGSGIMNRYSNLLLRPVSKALVIMIFSILYSICAVATYHLEIGYDLASMLPVDSYVISFENDLDEYTQRRVTADLYFQEVEQGDSLVQEQMKKYVNELVDRVDAIVAPPVNFWVTDYQDYLQEQEGALDGMPFNATLRRFLDDQRFDHKGSIILDDSGDIIASRAKIAFDNLDMNDAAQVMALMKSQAKVANEQPINTGRDTAVPSFFTFNAIYYLWDFLIEIEVELKITTIIGVTSMSLMALIFLPHWSGIIFVVPMIISLYVDMMGIFHLAGIELNGVSFVTIIMSLGLYVDYVLHVLLCYYESDGTTREEKVTRMLSTVGSSVLLGGLSTLFGTLPLAFTSSEVFHTVFVGFVAICVLGLSHGIILLPVLLSLVGPTEVVISLATKTSSSSEHDQASDSSAEVQSSSLDGEGVQNSDEGGDDELLDNGS